MPILKKGSKGVPVENLQKELNRLKAKPQLKPDGIFGTNTRKAVMFFQKRAKVKVDGEVGPVTTAAIQYGGPLPQLEMKVPKRAPEFSRKFREYNSTLATHLKSLDVTTTSLDTLLNQKVPSAEKMIKANAPMWTQVNKLLDRILFIQREFPLMRISDPRKAEKMVAEYDKLYKLLDVTLTKMEKNWLGLYETIDEAIAGIGDSIKVLSKQRKALIKHNDVMTA